MTKEDEIEVLCSEIRQAVGKIQDKNSSTSTSGDSLSSSPMVSLSDFSLGSVIAKGCSAVVYDANSIHDDDNQHPLAIKMMFNYHAASNALTIFRAMEKEIIPARISNLKNASVDPNLAEWLENELEIRSLNPHPNIVDMPSAFVDRIPNLTESLVLYPDALPTRLNPEGSGRNMSLFLVMKKYPTNLKDYLKNEFSQNKSLPLTTSISLLAQLLEGVNHLVMSGISHRDLKSDNILLEFAGNEDNLTPKLVITDFGCCSTSLSVPYPTRDVDKGGNVALMAPEVKSVRPGMFSVIDYSKADIWAVGSIAYEIFGLPNPRYEDGKNVKLPERIPPPVRNLILAMNQINPNERIDAELAATICQLLLWAPHELLTSKYKKKMKRGEQDPIIQWLLNVTTKVVVEARFSKTENLPSEYGLIASFLKRFRLSTVQKAVNWIVNNRN